MATLLKESLDDVGGASLARTRTAVPLAGSSSAATAASQLSRTTSAPSDPTLLAAPRVRSLRPRAQTGSAPVSARFVPIVAGPVPSSRTPSFRSMSPAMVTPDRRPDETVSLQSHLYVSGLLGANLSDVHIVAFGHLYRLHRIILNQCGFFESLLSGGFSEQQRKKFSDEEAIEVKMEPPMTRAAFEFILARLYGGGPELVGVPTATLDADHPLSHAFELVAQGMTKGNTAVAAELGSTSDWEALRASNAQPATPTFLISLLACATYLEVPTIQANALHMINSTMTPWTVGTYLRFALGGGLGSSVAGQELGCRGLESVGVPFEVPRSRTTTSSSSSFTDRSHSSSSSSDEHRTQEPLLFVGPENESVGEAAACYLAKWGHDIFGVEECFAGRPQSSTPAELPQLLVEQPHLRPPPLRVWSSLRGGISARWVRGVISSDTFFVTPNKVGTDGVPNGEWERYQFAKRVVEFRRKERIEQRGKDAERRRARAGKSVVRQSSQSLEESMSSASLQSEVDELGGIDALDADSNGKETRDEDSLLLAHDWDLEGEADQDELEYAELFKTGIHYSHLSFKQLQSIANDLSPTTKLPYTPLKVIQRAHWISESFRSRVPVMSPFGSSSHASYSASLAGGNSLDVAAEDSGLKLSTPACADVDLVGPLQSYFYVPIDDTVRINESPAIATDDPAVTPLPLPRRLQKHEAGEHSFFGIGLQTRMGTCGPNAVVLASSEEDLARSFVAAEPCRFATTFYNVADLQEKRLYSPTFFYGGSYYNLYVQRIVKSKTSQLGIYLHRQNPTEAFPVPSRPSSTTVASSSLLSEVFRTPPIAATTIAAPQAPYHDSRKAVDAYFAIWVSNQVGTSLTRFSSQTEQYNRSQSFGFKSSSLRSVEYIGGSSKLRVTVVMGLV